MSELAKWDGKRLKLFFVEMDDEDRERVLSCQVEYVTIEKDVEYADVMVGDYDKLVMRFPESIECTLTAKIVQQDDGTFFRLETFTEEDEDDTGLDPD